LALLPAAVQAGPGPTKQALWHYTLLEGSELTDDCLACGRPTIQVPLRGSFNVSLQDENPLFATYEVSDIEFVGGSGFGQTYEVKGRGTYRIGGELALIQEMFLTVRITRDSTVTEALLEAKSSIVQRLWPMLRVELSQTNGTPFQVYDLVLAAAPLREIWFSTGAGFHSGTLKAPANEMSAGDLLSTTGQPVRRQHELTQRLGIMPAAPDLGLDGLDVRAGGELAFTVDRGVFSETLGQLQEGDLLSDRGSILMKNQALLGAFGVQPPVPDLGLDAVHIVSERGAGPDEVWFSIEKDSFSEHLGQVLRHGDILSNRGVIVRSNRDLVSRFQPGDPTDDLGLDALYVWPSGEIWFSTEKGFKGTDGQTYAAGDLLSDHGYIVFRNLELLNSYAPVEDLADFGLDTVWVVTDFISPALAPRLLSIVPDANTGSVRLRWEGAGHVFQLEGASRMDGAYLPVSPILPDLEFEHLETMKHSPTQFYRLRQW
jgi:hypothetical protein